MTPAPEHGAEETRVRRFLENFGKSPAEPRPPLIPPTWRMRVFVAMVVVGLVGLALVIWLIVVPAIRTHNPGTGAARSSEWRSSLCWNQVANEGIDS